jgi:hypothetical protein
MCLSVNALKQVVQLCGIQDGSVVVLTDTRRWSGGICRSDLDPVEPTEAKDGE